MKDKAGVSEATENQRKLRWLRDEAGSCLDDLKNALASFEPKDRQSIIEVQQQLGRVEAGARAAMLPAIARTAEETLKAGALDICERTEALITLLRGAMRTAIEPERNEFDSDAETGLRMCACLRRRTAHLNESTELPHDTLAIGITGLDAIRTHRGNKAAVQAIAHVGTVLQKQLRKGDCLARLGGENLVVYLPGQDEKGIEKALTRLRNAVARDHIRWPDGSTESLTITMKSCGKVASSGSARPEVCVVSDSAIMESTLVHFAQRAGCEVTVSGPPEEGLWEAMSRRRFRLVLMDVSAAWIGPVLAKLTGLYACERTPIVAAVRDHQEAERALEQGARIALVKPLKPEDIVKTMRRWSSPGRGGQAKTAKKKKSCVLVASNDLVHLISVGTSLQRHAHYEVRLGRGGGDALERAKRHQPAVALIDLRMDYADADALLTALAAQQPPSRVVLLADDMANTSVRLLKAPGVVDVLQKPFDLIRLAPRIAETTGLAYSTTGPESSAILREEILRVM